MVPHNFFGLFESNQANTNHLTPELFQEFLSAYRMGTSCERFDVRHWHSSKCISNDSEFFHMSYISVFTVTEKSTGDRLHLFLLKEAKHDPWALRRKREDFLSHVREMEKAGLGLATGEKVRRRHLPGSLKTPRILSKKEVQAALLDLHLETQDTMTDSEASSIQYVISSVRKGSWGQDWVYSILQGYRGAFDDEVPLMPDDFCVSLHNFVLYFLTLSPRLN